MVYHRSQGTAGSSASRRVVNAFANDGSFMEMFKKMQEQNAGQSSGDGDGKSEKPEIKSEPTDGTSVSDKEASSEKPAVSKPPLVGKRRGGRCLATGKVKKLKAAGDQDEDEAPPKDAWSLYLAEVKKYKQTTCEEEGKTRPLVK